MSLTKATNSMIQGAPINVLDYGADPTGAVDSTLALRAACAALQAAGGGVLDFGSGTFKIYTDTGDTALIGDFSNLTGVELRSSGANLSVNRSFPTPISLQVIQFAACRNITIGDFEGSYAGSSRAADIYTSGTNFLSFIEGCIGITIGQLYFDNWNQVVKCTRDSGDSLDWISKNIVIAGIAASNVGYPLFTDLSGHNLTANVNAFACGRAYFAYSPVNATVTVTSKNPVGSKDCLLYATAGFPMQDVDLTYINLETTSTSVDTREGVALYFRDTIASVIKNINVHLDIESNTGFMNTGLRVGKYDGTANPDPTDRGHQIENLTITGYANIPNGSPLSLCTDGTWGLGEFVRNVNIHDFVCVGGQSNLNLASLLSQSLIENCFFEANMNLVGNTRGRLLCSNVTTDSITGTSAEATLQDYINCTISNAATQSVLGKTFLNTTINSVDIGQRVIAQQISAPTATSQFIGDTVVATMVDLASALADGQHALVTIYAANYANTVALVSRMNTTYTVTTLTSNVSAGTIPLSISTSNLQMTNSTGGGATFYTRWVRIL